MEADDDIHPIQLAFGSNKWKLYHASTLDNSQDVVP